MKNNNLSLREIILKQFDLCRTIATDIIRHDADEDILYYAKRYAQIESPITGETGAPWIRINYGDIYVFIDFDEKIFESENRIKFRKIRYQLDGCDGYGGETIEAESTVWFMVQFQKLSDEKLLEQHAYPDEDEDKVPEYFDYDTVLS